MNDKIKLFVYGTLRSKATCAYLGVFPKTKTPATLYGYEKQGLNIEKKEGSSVDGFVLQVTQQELIAIDKYEGVPSGYKRIFVEVNGENVFAYQYAS